MKKVIFTLLVTLTCSGLTDAQTLVDFANPADYDISGSWGYGIAPSVSGDTLYIQKDADATFDQGVQIIVTNPVTVGNNNSLLRVKAKLSGATNTGMRFYAKVFYQSGIKGEGWTNNTIDESDRFHYIVWDGLLPGEAVDTIILHFGGWDNGNAPAGLQGEIAVDEVSAVNPKMVPVADFEVASEYDLSTSWGYSTAPSIANGVLTIVKDVDGTFDQQVYIGLENVVTVSGGSTRLLINIKSSITGLRLYARVTYSDSVTYEGWTTNVIETADAVNGLILEGLSIGKTVDTVLLNLGGWDNGNAPAGLQGTYEVEDIYLTEPPVSYVPPRMVVEINHTTGDIDIEDGPAEADWQNATEYPVVNRDSSNMEDPNFKGTFRGLWNEDYLYLLIIMDDKDPFVFDNVAGSFWQKDGAQVYLDVRNQLLDGRKENSRQHQLSFTYGADPLQLGIGGWEGSTVDSIYDDRTKPYYCLYGSLPKSGGYYMELGIPWGSMYFDATNEDVDTYNEAYAAKSIAADDTVGFDIQYNDGDDLGRYNITTWSSNSADDPSSYQNSGVWGGLKLLPGAGTAVHEIKMAKANVYPNPASHELFVEMEGMTSLSISDFTGRQVLRQEVNTDRISLNVSSLVSGMYLIRIDGKAGIVSKKIQVK